LDNLTVDSLESTRAAFAAARASGKRAKEAAESSGFSEGEAVAAHVGEHAYAPKAKRLKGPWVELLQGLEACGPLLALTRNGSTVHEKTGVYKNVSSSGHMGLVLGEDIDLRLFFSKWHAGFAVKELAANPSNRPNWSLQFFDQTGLSVHKIFTREQTDIATWQELIDRFEDPVSSAVAFCEPERQPVTNADAAINTGALLDSWRAMRDTHEFFTMLRRHGVERQQSFRLVEGHFTRRIQRTALTELLMGASFEGLPIMCFVGSPGCIQIHTGIVKRIEPMDIRGVEWLNVIDPGFNLHLRVDSVSHVWAVEKPTSDGTVTSVEAFGQDGHLIAMFFGARKPGKPELVAWRDLVSQLPSPLADQRSMQGA
jgi:putative hemin transport protein